MDELSDDYGTDNKSKFSTRKVYLLKFAQFETYKFWYNWFIKFYKRVLTMRNPIPTYHYPHGAPLALT